MDQQKGTEWSRLYEDMNEQEKAVWKRLSENRLEIQAILERIDVLNQQVRRLERIKKCMDVIAVTITVGVWGWLLIAIGRAIQSVLHG